MSISKSLILGLKLDFFIFLFNSELMLVHQFNWTMFYFPHIEENLCLLFLWSLLKALISLNPYQLSCCVLQFVLKSVQPGQTQSTFIIYLKTLFWVCYFFHYYYSSHWLYHIVWSYNMIDQCRSNINYMRLFCAWLPYKYDDKIFWILADNLNLI